jgi:hypothetical protein
MEIGDLVKANHKYGAGNVGIAIIYLLFMWYVYDSKQTNKQLLKTTIQQQETNRMFVKELGKMNDRLEKIEGYKFVKEVKIRGGEVVYEIVPLGE